MAVMAPKLTRLELQVMQALWEHGGACSIREVQESFPARRRPAYTTVQTLMYRLEEKKAVRRTRKIGNAHLFEPLVSRDHAHRRLIDDLLAVFGGRSLPVLSHLIESGNLTLEDVKEAEEMLRNASRTEKPK
jgi:predicted transcriptional regulator